MWLVRRVHCAAPMTNNKKKQTIVFALSAAFAGGIAIPSVAHADRTSHGGGTCLVVGGGGTAYRINQGILGNSHYTKWLNVYCPVARSTGRNTPGSPCVNVIDRNQGQGVTCSFYDVRAYGHTWDWGSWKESSGNGPSNYKSLVWGGEGNSEDKFEGFHHFYCKIPPRQTSNSSNGITYLSSYSTGE